MEFFQTDTNRWGEVILLRASWWLLWVSIGGALLFLGLHFALRHRWLGEKLEASLAAQGLPEKIARHSLASRLFHWTMSSSMFVLLFTGFLPIVGIKFPWVTAHWIAGFVLIAAVIFHVIHVLVRRTLLEVWVGPRDIMNWIRGVTRAVGLTSAPPGKSGKYPVDNKLFHHAVVAMSIGFIGSGIIMMKRIENPILSRNTGLYSENTWGIIYTVHGLTAMALVGLVMTHLYFAILPEKRWITKAMFYGWIPRSKYLEHHDPERWKVVRDSGSSPADPPAAGETAVPDEP